jgi:hypothetical protein
MRMAVLRAADGCAKGGDVERGRKDAQKGRWAQVRWVV